MGRLSLSVAGVVLAAAVAACAPAPVTQPSPVPTAAATPSSGPSATATPTAAPSASGFALTGIVSALDRDLVAGATVTARQGDAVVATADTGADGRYALMLPAGDYVVTATKTGWTSRSRTIALAAASSLDFGPSAEDQGNPYWLADSPEIDRVDVEEAAPGGPMTLKVHFSEPIVKAGQNDFDRRFELRAGRSAAFIENDHLGALDVKPVRSWDAAGQVYTFTWAGPYLPSGVGNVEYTLMIDQGEEDTTDPESGEKEREELDIADAAGNVLGRGDARYAFVQPTLSPLTPAQLVERVYGYLIEDRRWRLSHQLGYTFVAKKDLAPPALTRVEVNTASKGASSDELRLTFNKPMRVARDANRLEWTQLDEDKPFLVLNVSKQKTGGTFEPLDVADQVRDIEFDPDDSRLVYVHFPTATFEDYARVEVTLTPDAKDPAGNVPDLQNNKFMGTIQ